MTKPGSGLRAKDKQKGKLRDERTRVLPRASRTTFRRSVGLES